MQNKQSSNQVRLPIKIFAVTIVIACICLWAIILMDDVHHQAKKGEKQAKLATLVTTPASVMNEGSKAVEVRVNLNLKDGPGPKQNQPQPQQ